ncbi:MAG: phosphatidate cytidylyltransferase [Gemmatimonadaceae bacterium]|nr:phosphatidate cytidylyltransferase [Gemmatimonadaceae bacterium]
MALIAAPIAIGMLWFGGATLAAGLSMVAALCAWEFFRIARRAGSAPIARLGIAAAAAVPLAIYATRLELVRPGWQAPVLGLLGLATAALWRRGAHGRPIDAIAVTALGVAYTGGALGVGYLLRTYPYAIGARAQFTVVCLPVLLCWATDIGAYFVGRAVGGAKLLPAVSPGKTISGAIGGLLSAVLVAWAYQRWVLRPVAELAFSPTGLVTFAVAVSVAGQVGDLVESMCKRAAEVKDSSSLLPGHGGFLDRLDSVLFALPVAHVLYDALVLAAPLSR